ncbi:TPA: hypothetical protein SIA33_000195 [Aeromonas salmonicida]|nr:hypothetical protein [Aeromonas salmonicida]
MEQDLNISLLGFNEESTAKLLGELTLHIMKSVELEYQLDISRLKRVIITFDFQTALQDIANQYNHLSIPTYTDSKQAKAVAKLFSKLEPDGKSSEYALVLSVNFFADIFDDEGKISLSCISPVIHMIHHELAHVHEYNRNALDESRMIDDYDDIFLMTAKRVWAEYLANYMSSPTAPDKAIVDMLFTLETVLNEVPLEIERFILDHKRGLLSLVDMHSSIVERIKLISAMYGYAQGYIQSLNIDLESQFRDLHDVLSSSCLCIPLQALGESLPLIKREFDKDGLCEFEVFEPAIKAIRAMYASFGLRIERTNEPGMGLFIHVL